MSEPITFSSKFYGQRHTALMVVRSLAIWVSTVGMLTVMIAPAFFQNKNPSNSTVIGALLLFAIAQGFQTLTLLAWRIPDDRKVCWDPKSQSLTTYGYRVISKPWTFGQREPEFRLALREIREVTWHKGRASHLVMKTTRGVLRISNDLEGFTQLADLIMHQVQSSGSTDSQETNSSDGNSVSK